MIVFPARQLPSWSLFLGWGVLAAVCAAIGFGQPHRSFFTEWALIAVVLSPIPPLVLNRRALRGLAVTHVDCPAFYQNQRGRLRVTIANARTGAVGDVWVRTYDVHAQCDLEGLQCGTVELPLVDHDRGVFPLPPMTLGTDFPFRLFQAQRYVFPSGTYTVYPAPEPNAPAWPPPAQTAMRRARRGEDVLALRAYRWGDALSSVDWKVSARHGDLMVREYEEPDREALTLSFEQVRDLGVEAGLSRLAAWVLRAESQGLRYGLVLEQEALALAQGPSHQHACLTALAAFRRE